ncbi:MAG: GDSL-type esterase/lipase family protein [Eubacteriales bacterium]|nr:GDSL-type esterase/lipase family protein [Eubacteriales bacterium]MDD3881594.1 GDSL-type esterase/lipase family protein [Eubacteriales bacterium]MDD4512347.1 GDSL-type esterase/lipase family protein [Eubacteriales bacterium]
MKKITAILTAIVLLLSVSPAFCEDNEHEIVISQIFVPNYPAPHVDEAEAVADDYFDDAVFAGDSIVSSLEMYGQFTNAEFVSKIGLSPSAAANFHEFETPDNPKATFAEAIAYHKPKKVYLLLGSNGLDKKLSGDVILEYTDMLSTITTLLPETIIYVLGTPPMTKGKMAKYKNCSPGRYRVFNEELLKLCGEFNIYYLDIYGLVKNKNGYLNTKYSAGDGLHFNRDGCELVAEYIKKHAVPYDTGAPAVTAEPPTDTEE